MWFIDIGFQLLNSTFALACKTTHKPNKYAWSLGVVLTHANNFLNWIFHVANEITYYAPKKCPFCSLRMKRWWAKFSFVGFLCFHHVPNVFFHKFPITFPSCFSNFQYVPNMFPLVPTSQLHSQKVLNVFPYMFLITTSIIPLNLPKIELA